MLNGFASAESLAKHKKYCKKHPVARRDLPKPKNATLQFNHLNYSMMVPVIIIIIIIKQENNEWRIVKDSMRTSTIVEHLSFPELANSRTMYIQEIPPAPFSFLVSTGINLSVSVKSLVKNRLTNLSNGLPAGRAQNRLKTIKKFTYISFFVHRPTLYIRTRSIDIFIRCGCMITSAS